MEKNIRLALWLGGEMEIDADILIGLLLFVATGGFGLGFACGSAYEMKERLLHGKEESDTEN